jgi:putative FmdB family regulatory protein
LPLYPYHCTQCGYGFEKIQSFSAKPERKCPECGGKLERVLSAPGLSFKGAGWYVNDYSSKSKAPGAAAGAKTESGSAGSETKAASGGDSAAASPAAAAPSPAPAASKPASGATS